LLLTPKLAPGLSAILRDRDYHRLLAAAACNYFGMNGELVVFSLLVFRITQSSAWVGTALALYYLPLLVFGMVAGAVADWMDRRRLLRIIELALTANLALFGTLIALGLTELWYVLAMVFFSGSIRAMYQPVRSAYVYDLVGGEHVVSGLSTLNLVMRLGQLAGALVAGIVMERAGAHTAYFALCAAHLVAFGILGRLRTAGTAAALERVPIAQNLREYVAEMRRNRTLAMLVVITASVEVFGFSFSTALPELATKRLGMGAEGLGVMHAFRAVGGLVAGALLAGYGGFRYRGMVYLVVIYAFGASVVLLALSPSFVLAVAALALVAALAAASDILTQSMMQLSVPNHLRGRAMGAWVFAIGSAPLGHLELGALAAALGVGTALGINGAVLIGVGVVTTVLAPGLRRL